MMTKLKATLRIEKHSGECSLFYYDERRELICYSLEEGHSAASLEYMYKDTLPLKLNSKLWAEAAAKFGTGYYYKARISVNDNV